MTSAAGKGRSVATVNGIVAALLIAVLAVFAIVVTPPSPPGIAELAPRASRPIAKAPAEQALPSKDGNGCADRPCDAGRPLGVPVPTSSAGPGAGRPSALQCYAWPDGSVTQTFDPQSPACMASWPEAAGGNGGSTATGVSASTVTVAVNTERFDLKDWQVLARFFSTRYQLYGRTLQVVAFPRKGLADDPSAQAAHAKGVAAIKVFGATDYSYFYDSAGIETELAKRGVHYFQGAAAVTATTSATAERYPGLIWAWYPEHDRRMRATGAFLCRALADHPRPGTIARRSFAVVRGKTRAGTPDVRRLVESAAACRAPLRVVDFDSKETQSFNGQNASPALTAMMVDLSRDGVTSLIPTGPNEDWVTLFNAAERAGYQPEWILPGTLRASDLGARTFRQSQLSRTFGLDREPPAAARTQSMWFRAMAGVDQDAARRLASASEVSVFLAADQAYAALALVAAGIQAAGPRLTTATLREGMHALDFPNPGAGKAPFRLQRVGFADQSYSAVTDYAIRWWSNSSTSRTHGGLGTWCYLDGGTRFNADSMPTNVSPAEEAATC